MGVTVESQDYTARLDHLCSFWPGLRFISAEPLLGRLDLTPWLDRLDLVIAGGESGPKGRPCHPDWARSLRDQCAESGTPFLWKQWGRWRDVDCRRDLPSHGVLCFDGTSGDRPWDMIRCRSKADSGRLLDGVTHDGWFGDTEG